MLSNCLMKNLDEMDNKEYLKYCKVYKGEDENPYRSPSNKDDELKKLFWNEERAGVCECIEDNISDKRLCSRKIFDYVYNGVNMYVGAWAGGNPDSIMYKYIEMEPVVI